jgi:sugar O-acyltransferase (sialic acid O-acetyltransferase NeuD family)
LIGGAGGFARETIEIVRALEGSKSHKKLGGVLDDDPALFGTTCNGVPIIGALNAIWDHPGSSLVLAIANSQNVFARRTIADRLGLPDDRYDTLVHPSAALGESVSVAAGTIIHANTTATADIQIGRHIAVMPNVVLTHDNVIADYATLASGVMLAGGVRVGSGAYLGAGALVREGLVIGEGALIGMGSIVTKNVPAGETWFGSPATKR